MLKLLSRFLETDILDRGAQVAFYFSFAIFPLALFLINLFGLLLESAETLRGELFSYLIQVMPRSAYELVAKTIEEVAEGSSTGKLTLGIAVTLWSASAGMESLRNALNTVYQLREQRPWWKTKLLSIGITLVLIISVGAVLVGVFYGWQLFQMLLSYMGMEVTSPLLLVTLQWTTIILVMVFACELIFNVLPNFKPFRWIWITPGSIVAIVFWIILSGGFRLYLQYFNSYNRTYGSLGAVIILLLWLYLTAMTILLGGAINSVLDEIRGVPPETECPDESLGEPPVKVS